jgi:ABC-type sulfate transport system permease subunit
MSFSKSFSADVLRYCDKLANPEVVSAPKLTITIDTIHVPLSSHLEISMLVFPSPV